MCDANQHDLHPSPVPASDIVVKRYVLSRQCHCHPRINKKAKISLVRVLLGRDMHLKMTVTPHHPLCAPFFP